MACGARTAPALGAVTLRHRPQGARRPGPGARGGRGIRRAALLDRSPRAGTGPGGRTVRSGRRPRSTLTVAAVIVLVRRCDGAWSAGRCGTAAGCRRHGQGPASRNPPDAAGVAGHRRTTGRGRGAARSEHPRAEPGAPADRRRTDRGGRGRCGRRRCRSRSRRRWGRWAGEWAVRRWGGQAGPAGPVSLSTATEQQLDSLPGVGPVLARHIIEFRTQHGGFTSVDQLRQVTGIGDRRFADLRPLVQP